MCGVWGLAAFTSQGAFETWPRCPHVSALASSYCLVVWMYHSLFIHSTADGHLGGFQFRAIANKAAPNILECVFWWPYVELY